MKTYQVGERLYRPRTGDLITFVQKDLDLHYEHTTVSNDYFEGYEKLPEYPNSVLSAMTGQVIWRNFYVDPSGEIIGNQKYRVELIENIRGEYSVIISRDKTTPPWWLLNRVWIQFPQFEFGNVVWEFNVTSEAIRIDFTFCPAVGVC